MEFGLNIGDRAALGEAFDRLDPAPSACTANIRQECTAWPSSCTRQAPQAPISQPACVPVSSSALRRQSDQRLARRDLADDLAAIHDEANAHGLVRISRRDSSKPLIRLSETAEHAAQQNAGEVQPHRRRHMLVAIGWREIAVDARLRCGDASCAKARADERSLRSLRPRRRISDGKERDPDVVDAIAGEVASMPQPTSA